MGLQLEAEGKYDAAKKLYKSLLGLPAASGGDAKGKARVLGPDDVRWEGEGDETFIVSLQRVLSRYSTN